MKQFDTWLQKNSRLLYWLFVAFAAVMYGVFSLEQLVWADEAYTFALIRHSFAQIWQITAADVHPPLYYFLLKLLAAPAGYNLFLCRFLSALPCVLVAAIGGWQLRKLFGDKTALLFMGLYLLFPYAMGAAAEVRMYGLSQLFVMLCAIFAYRAWLENSPKSWALFALFGTCAAYTHYFALVSAGVIYGLLFLALLLKKRPLWKGWALASLATIVLFTPWLGSFLTQLAYKVSNEYWIEPITLSTVVGYILSLFGASGMTAFPIFFCLSYAVALLALVLCKNRKVTWLGLAALAVPLGTVAVGLLASILVRPVFVIRYILPSVPLLVFFFAYALGNLKNEMLLSSLVTVCLMGGISNGLVTAKGAVFPPDNRITKGYVASLPERDAYVVLTGNTMHASQELSHWDSQTPIYTVDPIGPDNPYPNRIHYESFDMQACDQIILVLAQGEAIPEPFASAYTAQALDSVVVSGTGQELWYLVRK